MKQINYKKLILPNIPYVFFVYLFDKVGQAVRLAPGADISAKILNITQGFSAAFENALPSVYPLDLLVGIVGAVIIRLIVYVKGKNAKKYRKGAEYGSARWATFPQLKEALQLIKAWGFTYKSVAFVWLKQNRKSPTWFYGLGFWTRGNAEICLLATKGHPKRQSNKVHQFIISPVEQHSKKPDITREKILALMGDLPRIELFARQHTPGWDVWGNEIKSDIRFAGKEV